jgi:hypothetical protein
MLPVSGVLFAVMLAGGRSGDIDATVYQVLGVDPVESGGGQ